MTKRVAFAQLEEKRRDLDKGNLDKVQFCGKMIDSTLDMLNL